MKKRLGQLNCVCVCTHVHTYICTNIRIVLVLSFLVDSIKVGAAVLRERTGARATQLCLRMYTDTDIHVHEHMNNFSAFFCRLH